MKKILLSVCLFTTLIGGPCIAQVTDTPCANGAGIVVKGAIQGEYCISTKFMNWWNAMAWCDGMRMKPLTKQDCACGNTTADCAYDQCPNFKNLSTSTVTWYWVNMPDGPQKAQGLQMVDGKMGNGYDRSASLRYAICK